MERKRDRPPVSPKPPRSADDRTGRTTQLEVILAATKTQLSEECMHSRELQERLGKIQSDRKDTIKKAVLRAHDQAERDLVAIKRQHSQFVQSLQNRISKLQSEHAKGIVAYHQLERKLLQQQQEFVHTLNQRDNEFRKSLDAKEIEVNGLLDEQNALLNKLKKFWRPILNSSAAKIFTEKTQRTSSTSTPTAAPSQESKPDGDKSRVQTPRYSQACKSMECNSEVSDRASASARSVETQTVVGWRSEQKKKPPTRDYTSESEQENTKKERKDIRTSRPSTTGSQNPSRPLTTIGRKMKPDPKVKKNEDDLISSYLSKLQKTYVSSNKQQPQFKSGMNTRGLDALLERAGHIRTPTSASLSEEGRLQAEVRPASRQSAASSDSQAANEEPLPQYIICVSPQEAGVRNPIYSTPRKRQTSETSTSALQEKLENLEALSETLLGQRM
ncbi:hypothetical protein R1sor_026183 [Riccia sorocarpa]|uniref:Uncharacterized protein n=1 Tax=Riccia sorocarpa TaxID=122646 RepID=A0ABD3GDR3_9MARC